jgi:phage/plasmid-like protein (TIGR03299 family)
MSHEINSLAYVGAKPWHGLGNLLPPGASLENWTKAAGMDWQIRSAGLQYEARQDEHASVQTYPGQSVLYRSDNLQALSVVGSNYKIVQPAQVLEFFSELVKTRGYELETAGCLKEGRRFWALAKMGDIAMLPGDDAVEGRLLVCSSCDSTLATTIIPTSIRVVCQNTLHASLHGAEGGLRIPHSMHFDIKKVQQKLDAARKQWEDYVQFMHLLARRRLSKSEATRFFALALGGVDANDETGGRAKRHRALDAAERLYAGAGKGLNRPGI